VEQPDAAEANLEGAGGAGVAHSRWLTAPARGGDRQRLSLRIMLAMLAILSALPAARRGGPQRRIIRSSIRVR
jgi:hypothetical protein